ncbi:MAG TPA: response regulator [Pirellulales bacterium]|jgi:CheY-like chemotaxis protein
MTGNPPERIRALIVDDDRDTVRVMTRLLELIGCEAIGCVDPADCAKIAIRTRPHLIFVDISMPVMDGFAVAQEIRRNGLTLGLLVALTSYGDEACRQRCTEAGFDEFLLKPATREQLRDLTRSAAEIAASKLRPTSKKAKAKGSEPN